MLAPTPYTSVHGPSRSGSRYCSGAANPGVYIGASFGRFVVSVCRAAPKSSSTGLPSVRR